MGAARLSSGLGFAVRTNPIPTPHPNQAICVDDFPDLEYGKVGEIVGLTDDAADDFILVRFPESMPQGYPPQVTNPNPHPHLSPFTLTLTLTLTQSLTLTLSRTLTLSLSLSHEP